MESPEDMAMAGSLAETIFACHTSRLGTLNALLRGGGTGTGTAAAAPRRPYMRGSPPVARRRRRRRAGATFPAPLTPSGQQAPGPAAPASAPLCPASLFPPGAASAPSGRPARRGEARSPPVSGLPGEGGAGPSRAEPRGEVDLGPGRPGGAGEPRTEPRVAELGVCEGKVAGGRFLSPLCSAHD